MVFVAIDAGTTGVRCMIIDSQGKSLGISRRSWTYTTPRDLEIAKEFDPAHFWKLTCTVVTEAIKQAKVRGSDLEAVATTSQRHGSVFLDKNGDELYAGPNIDARGAMTQYIIEESLGERYHEITGCWPPLMFTPSRLSWFEEEEPELFESIVHVLPISDWITYRLGNVFVTDPSSASGTGFLDIAKFAWSDEVIETLGVDSEILPEIHPAGSIVGEVTADAEKECGLPKGLPLVQGGADTHCAVLACVGQSDEIVIISGSTTPIMMIIDKLHCDPEQKFWTGCHVVPGKWVLESNAALTGAYLDWALQLLCERSESFDDCIKRTLSDLDKLLTTIPPGSNETFIDLGPNVMDCQKMTDIRQARMTFPQPALPQVVPLNSARLIHAVLENIAYAVRGNCEQIERYRKATCIKTIGGMTQSRKWPELLANILGREVHTPSQPEGSLLGAGICAATGVGQYSSLMDAANSMVHWNYVNTPDERADIYKSYYSKWTRMHCEDE